MLTHQSKMLLDPSIDLLSLLVPAVLDQLGTKGADASASCNLITLSDNTACIGSICTTR